MLKQLFGALGKVRRELYVLFFLSVVAYLGVELYLRYLPPPFRGISKVWDLISNLSLSYMASFTFYFIADHWEKEATERAEKERLNRAMVTILSFHHELMKQACRILQEKEVGFEESFEINVAGPLVNRLWTHPSGEPLFSGSLMISARGFAALFRPVYVMASEALARRGRTQTLVPLESLAHVMSCIRDLPADQARGGEGRLLLQEWVLHYSLLLRSAFDEGEMALFYEVGKSRE